MGKKHALYRSNIKYFTKMDSYVYNKDYPTTKNFTKKTTAMEFIKRALRIYPYVKIILYKEHNNVFRPIEEWKMVRNKHGGLSPKGVKM